MAITFEELVQAAQQLNSTQKALLMQRLRYPEQEPVTAESLLAELEALRAAGAFDVPDSLYGMFSERAAVSAEELDDYLLTIGSEWNQDFDDIDN
ncbi:MAG: hypothetical protein SF162_19685 [bacterium]|nr:hypothetical protein [bacterium]